MAVEDGNDCDSLVGQVMEQGGCNFQPNNMPNKLQKSREDDPHIDNNLKANMDWTKAVNCVQRTIAQYSQFIMKCMAQWRFHGQRSDVWCEHPPMTNIKECYEKVLAQSKSITDLLLEGPHVDWKQIDVTKFTFRLDYIKAVLNTTNATKDIGNMIMC
jgi:hypothetical protein